MDRYRNSYEWIGFFDADEFYNGEDSIKDYLLKAPAEIDAIYLQMRNFGDNGLEGMLEKGQSLKKMFTRCADYMANRHNGFKYFARTERVRNLISPHIIPDAELNMCLADFRITSWGMLGELLSPCLNHYIKTREEYDERAKLGRADNTQCRIPYHILNRNETEDSSINRERR